MNSTAYHPAGDPTVGHQPMRSGMVIAGIAVALAVALLGVLSVGGGAATQQAAEVDRPPDVMSQEAATDTMITRTHGNATATGQPTATDTMITRTHGNATATGQPTATDTMITRTRGNATATGQPTATDTMITRTRGSHTAADNTAGGTDTMVTRGKGG